MLDSIVGQPASYGRGILDYIALLSRLAIAASGVQGGAQGAFQGTGAP